MADIDTQAEKPSVKPKATADACPEALEMVATRRTDVEAGEMVNEKAPPEIETVDMFKPLPPHHLLPDEPYQLSPRASSGLKAGIGNDANMFATLLGYVAPVTVATSTGGLSVLFFSAIPGMYQLGLLTSPRGDFGKMVAVSSSAAFFGSAISVPLRKIFVLEFGQELDLVFLSAAAVAISIRQLHLGGKDYSLRQSTVGLVSSFSAATVRTVGSSYARGILWDWNITWLIYQWGNYANRAIHAVNWGFFTIEWTPALTGIGMLVPLNVGLSWLLGYFIGFGVIGPIIVAKGLAVGVAYNLKPPELMTYMGLESLDLISAASSRHWLMWPAIRVMICATFTDVLVNWKLMRHALRVAGSRLAGSLHRSHTRLGWSFGNTTPSNELVKF
ncbi:hypothetical protein CEP53_014938 [Fusarium sp. AF-6]|nr:hypothetical protein CEP53_014938 [Fusarium sp. AF-6]